MRLEENGKALESAHIISISSSSILPTWLMERNPNQILSNWGYDCRLHDKTSRWCQVWTFSQTHYEPI
jgi:hypothetical protein